MEIMSGIILVRQFAPTIDGIAQSDKFTQKESLVLLSETYVTPLMTDFNFCHLGD